MHPYEVEIHARERQRDIQLEAGGRHPWRAWAVPGPAWRDRLLWQLGCALVGYGRRLCRASGMPTAASSRRGPADLIAG